MIQSPLLATLNIQPLTAPILFQEFERHQVKDVIRVCDPTYATAPLEQLGIKVYVSQSNAYKLWCLGLFVSSNLTELYCIFTLMSGLALWRWRRPPTHHHQRLAGPCSAAIRQGPGEEARQCHCRALRSRARKV